MMYATVLAVLSMVAAQSNLEGKTSILVQQSLDENARVGGVVPGNGCLCVPYWQCRDGEIITDGSGLIDPRRRPQTGNLDPRCSQDLQVCCLPPGTPRVTTPKPHQHKCGIRGSSGVDSRIVTAGIQSNAKFAEWPWQAAVLVQSGSSPFVFQAGAVLIDDQHLLTAAHRVINYVSRSNDLTVRLGSLNLSSNHEEMPKQDLVVEEIIIHPLFDNNNLHNDIAVLRVKGHVHFAQNVDTICLPAYKEQHVNQKCFVTGWGKDSFDGKYSKVLKEVQLTVVDFNTCQDALRQSRLGTFFILDPSFLCAGGQQGLDACIGDGGGPLACIRKDGTYALIGIVSWGINCGQPGLPGVYVNVVKYLDWIAQSTDCPLVTYWP